MPRNPFGKSSGFGPWPWKKRVFFDTINIYIMYNVSLHVDLICMERMYEIGTNVHVYGHVYIYIIIYIVTRPIYKPLWSCHVTHLLGRCVQADVLPSRIFNFKHAQGSSPAQLGRTCEKTCRPGDTQDAVFPTVDGQNPAPPRMIIIPLFIGF